MDCNRVGRICAAVWPALVVVVLLPRAASAQAVTEDYIVNHLGPAAVEMQSAGVDPSGDDSPLMIKISQRWRIEPAFGVTVEEAYMLVRSSREDGVRERMASRMGPIEAYPSRGVLARFGVMRVGLTCAQTQEKARTAQRLADTLSRVSQLNAAGAGMVGAISQGAARFVAPMAFATMVTGFASSWAGQLATAYRTAPCLAGGQLWPLRPKVLRTSLFLVPSHVPYSSFGPHGSAFVASHIGHICRPQALAYRSFCPSASGCWRSS